jgi:hypothetical protein
MAQLNKIGLLTIFLSNRHYLTEIPVEGKASSKFNLSITFYDRYISQIIRAGNCITLVTTKYEITEQSFWNINHFEDYAKYIFWTFNKSFLLKITEAAATKQLYILQRCQALLKDHLVAYSEPIPEDADEELRFCYRKNANMKKDKKFALMYSMDEENRTSFLSAVEKRIAEFTPPHLNFDQIRSANLETKEEAHQAGPAPKNILFMEVLRPMDGSPENTLKFIKDKVEEAGFEFKLFSPVNKLSNGKNPYGLNGCMAAMIDFFSKLHYFKKDYSLEEIFKAYLTYSGNSLGKLHSFLAEFRDDKSYEKHFAKLKALKINKLL